LKCRQQTSISETKMNKIKWALIDTYKRRRIFNNPLSSAIDAIRRAFQVWRGQ